MPTKTLRQIELEAIEDTFKSLDGDRYQTASALGISLRTLDYKLEELNLTIKRDKTKPSNGLASF